MPAVPLLDINTALGRTTRAPCGFDSPRLLLDEMARLGIHEALVYHVLAAEADVTLGNRLLIEQLDGCADLYPCWVMAPSALGDLPGPTAWVREALAVGVRAVRLFPRHSLYTLAEWCVGPLLAELENAGLPVLIDFGPRHWSERVVPWDHLDTLCRRHPGLNVVIIGATVGETRDAVSLVRRWPNLFLEFHAFNLPDGLSLLAKQGLAHKLLFGTGMPLRAGECVTTQTVRSGLSPEDLAAVSGGNARELLNVTGPRDTGQGNARHMAGVDGLVVDAHAHAGAWERTITPVRTPEDIVRSMDRCGVHKMVVSSFAAIHGEMRDGNQQTERLTAQFPDRLYGYAGINPHYPEELDNELSQCFDRAANFVGLKFHCGLHNAPVQYGGYERALVFANERGLPVLVHASGNDDWPRVTRRYPHAAFIIAHACAWDGWDPAGAEAYRPVRDIANLYVDVAGSAAHRGALRALLELVGADKVLFGSDFPMFDLAFEFGRVASSDLAAKDKAAICGANARRIFTRMR